VHRAIFGPSSGDEGVQVLEREQRSSELVVNTRARLGCTLRHTLDFGTAAFGLQAALTTLSKEDIVDGRRGYRNGRGEGVAGRKVPITHSLSHSLR